MPSMIDPTHPAPGAAAWDTWTTDYRSPRILLTIPNTDATLTFDWSAAVRPF